MKYLLATLFAAILVAPLAFSSQNGNASEAPAIAHCGKCDKKKCKEGCDCDKCKKAKEEKKADAALLAGGCSKCKKGKKADKDEEALLFAV